ncbi:ATP-dependent helicase [Candidatus Saccharibacteria bacterium]|nr:ATP-dependent helicase [Candidatus Saccharibacteria bacterium]
MGLNKNQKKAVEYLDGPLLVLAGPGTGKTQLLSEKVAYILKNTDTNPENILCLTFTESGASNMRERLKTIIGIDAMKVNIGTYHAFGTDILSQYKNYSDNYDRNLDSAIDEVSQYKIIKNIQEQLPGTDILRGDNIKGIIDVISSAKSAGLSASNLKLIAETNIEDSKILSQAISPLLKNVVPKKFRESFDNAYHPIFEILSSYVNVEPILPSVERSIGELARSLKEAIVDAEALEKIAPLTKWRNDHFEKDGNNNYRLKDRIANKKLLSIANVMAKYNDYLLDNNLYDFDDMIQEAVKVLASDNGFKLTLSERYQFIMLDEFQDTNPSQFSIIKQLTDYEKPNIMAVGDDDQAIYEFQGALSTNLLDFQNHYSAEVIPLVENYRSTQEILDFSRNIINQASDRFADKELFSHQENPKTSQIFRHEFKSSDMEYSFVADKIAELINKGVPQNEIAVISYMKKYFMPLLPYLKSHPEINIAFERQDNLFEDQYIHEILSMCRLVFQLKTDKVDSSLLLEVLGYPFFDLPMISILKVIESARAEKKSIFDCLSSYDDERIHEVAQFFSNLVARSFTEPLEIIIDYLIGVSELNGYCSPFLKYYTSSSDYKAYSLYENIASLRGKLYRHFGDKKIVLDDLIEMVDDYESADMPLNTTSPYKESASAVQVLTAHKAKGLEFQYVFIISADHSAWGKGKGNNNTLSLPKNLMQIRHTGTTDGEKLRILYVALTRAKKSIYITNSLADFNGKSAERLEYLNEYLENDTIISPYLPSKEVICHYEEKSLDVFEKNLKNWLSPFIEYSPDLRSIYNEQISHYRMSATSLTTFIDIVYAGPQEFFKREILHVPSGPEDESLAFGNLIHKTFEKVTNEKISDQEAIDFFLSELEERGIQSDIKQHLKERGPTDLAVSLKAFGDILRQGKAEVNLGPEKIVVNGIPLTGKIDHIIVDEKNKTLEIYDYKTAGYHKEKWQSHTTLYKYMLQLLFYKVLLNNSHTYRKYKITTAHILFVVPDKKDGLVYDKPYYFDQEDENNLLDLMSSVYKLISSLEFIDDKDVFIPSDKNATIKDIKQFITLLLAKNS